ncbi:hypothetical protein LTR62_001028 [Meristemomyces frigidus]|uniref:Transcription initiation factor TFIID subunit 2 n=1 Tax=Meristemomyces frigidus TaxID=1508187 RepID=A0AAN7T8N7_9PEZI|nr:hypothetical protein LTR62_001028 [Meristemomyces frigidus]
MPGLVEDAVGSTMAMAMVMAMAQEYTILKQRVDLDVDFATQTIKGSTEITLQPLVKELKRVQLHCRQCRPTSIYAGGITAKYEYDDPYQRLRMPRGSTVHQHQLLKEKIGRALHPRPDTELTVLLPPKLKIQELHLEPVNALPRLQHADTRTPTLQKQESEAMAAVAETSTLPITQSQGPQFAPIKLSIEFETTSFRDGIHWVGCEDGDKRYPYMYTKAERWPGNTSCIFPCLDDRTTRCSWDISIRCARTLGDAFRVPPSQLDNLAVQGDVAMTNGLEEHVVNSTKAADQYQIDLSEEDAALELAVICVGDQVEDVIDTEDETRHTLSFSLNDPVAARHVGFAIGSFERIDLTSARPAEAEERLGQSANKIDGFCLPGRGDEVRNTCFPMTRAMDFFALTYGSFPFHTYQMLFVDDLIPDTAPCAGLSLCNSHLLFPETIIEPMDRNTRVLIRALADQWVGVSVIAKEAADAWAISGIAGYMSECFGKVLFGNNDYRWQQKLAAEKVYELDADRPSLSEHGPLLHLDPSVRSFLDLKSALVLFILDRRLIKSSGVTGVQRIVNRIFMAAKSGSLENGLLSTADFQRQCEKLGHSKLESFFTQWVKGAGCPIFHATQKFNKKKLVVEMVITQRQLERQTKPAFAPGNFMREIKEFMLDIWAPPIQPVFTGPMTIRIHEADGTPYEHIVEIKEAVTKLEIPYNTKYKRLKRSRRQKDRIVSSEALANANNENTGAANPEDSLLYCLGDNLSTPEEATAWNLVDWSADDESHMGQENFEWIRMDADFEWLGKIHLNMPLYMYVSQMQQDRDLVAQYESMVKLMSFNPHHVSLSILVRTLMDRRYFHGMRTMAAEGIAILAAGAKKGTEEGSKLRELGTFHLQKAFEELFCFPGESMPRPNDWSNRVDFLLQCAIPRAMAKLRDVEEKVPLATRQFFLEKLRFNDNSDNPYSDTHYITTLMTCLADSLVASHHEAQPTYTFNFGGDSDDVMETANIEDEPLEADGINAIERYRRMDEWDPSYHNNYSLTALFCLQKLTRAGMAKDKIAEVLQYTRASNADLVRVRAFRCLVEIAGGQSGKWTTVLRYLLHSIAEERSPWVRERLMGVLGEALGRIALGSDSTSAEIGGGALTGGGVGEGEGEEGLLLLEESSAGSAEARHREASRRTSPEGALAALKFALEGEDVVKAALWEAATTSGVLTLGDVAAMCDIAGLIYKPITSSIVILRLPRMWRVKREGKGTMRFQAYGPYRSQPRKPLEEEDHQQLAALGLRYTGPIATPTPEPPAELRRRQSSLEDIPLAMRKQLQASQQRQGSMGPPPTPAVQSLGTPTPTMEKPIIKLKLGGAAGEKRKASIDLASTVQQDGRAGSPKAPKLSISAGAGRAQSPKSATHRNPSVAAPRRGSTPAIATGKAVKKQSAVIRLPLNIGSQAKVREILSLPPKPTFSAARRKSAVPAEIKQEVSRSITPTQIPAATSPSFPPPPSTLLHSPSTSFGFSSPQQTQPQMNLGAFRSYAPLPSAIPATSAEPVVKSEAIVADQQSADSKSLSMGDAGDMPPPLKKKFTLKLGGHRKSVNGSTGAGSPQ